MIFANPLWLWGIPLLLVVAAALRFLSGRVTARRAASFCRLDDSGLEVLRNARRATWLPFFAPLLAMVCVLVALARPLTGPKAEAVNRQGVDFVAVLDVSRSMWAEDVEPNRLSAVKSALENWLASAGGDRMGLVVFAGEAMVLAPLTFDHPTLLRVLQRASPGSVSEVGTNIAAGIEAAAGLLQKAGSDTRTIVIISDGENLIGDAQAAAAKAHRDGVAIFTVGVGTEGGARVPRIEKSEFEKLPPERRTRRDYVRTEYGTEVVSQLDEPALRAIASAGGGVYEAFRPDPEFFSNFRNDVLLPLARSRRAVNPSDFHEWFQIPLIAALLVLTLAPLAGVRRPRPITGTGVAVIHPERSPNRAPLAVRLGPRRSLSSKLPLGLFLLFVWTLPAQETLEKDIDSLLSEERAAEAVERMRLEVERQPADLRLRYNQALTLYRAERFEEAAEILETIKSSASDADLKSKVIFQLGNAKFRMAGKLGTQPASVLALERALDEFQKLLAVDPTPAAEHNRKATEDKLAGILRKLADDQLKAAATMAERRDTVRMSRTLRDALDALERLATLRPEDRSLAAEIAAVKEKLATSLMADAAKHAAETDKIEAENDPGRDRQVFGRREQVIEILQRAQIVAPENADVQPAIDEQREKMSDLLTKRVAARLEPILQKDKLNAQDLHEMARNQEQLRQALDWNPENKPADDLLQRSAKRLEEGLLAAAEAELETARKAASLRNRLDAALKAGDLFQRTLEQNPDNARAAEGLKEIAAILPDLHAEVAALDLADAKKLVEAEEPPANHVERAVVLLEAAAQNFAKAVDLKPEDESVRQGQTEASELLGKMREQLHEQRLSAVEPETASPPAAAPAGQTELYSRPTPYVDPNASGQFWNRARRDW